MNVPSDCVWASSPPPNPRAPSSGTSETADRVDGAPSGDSTSPATRTVGTSCTPKLTPVISCATPRVSGIA
ncbi:MAG: hypothetical protein QF463_12635 [Vicinamibacterales bacterium]|nr:hypothetical protein [Vicinamibacterales bacterium]MDP6609908.1 hypothetical protein [Vicinamibacterales bacterium]